MATVKVKADFPSAPPGEEFNIVGIGNVTNGHTTTFDLTREQVAALKKNPNLVVVSQSTSVAGKVSEAKEERGKTGGKPSETVPLVPPNA